MAHLTETIPFRTTPQLRAVIVATAERRGTTVSRLVARIVEAHFRKQVEGSPGASNGKKQAKARGAV
jgi:hypothetical protein